MKRKNKDWCISLEDGVSKKLVKLFFKECGLKPYSQISISDSKQYCSVKGDDNKFQACYAIKHRIEFKIPSQWRKAKEYICEEVKDLEVGKWYKFEDEISKVVGRVSEIERKITLKDWVLDENDYSKEETIDKDYIDLAIELTQEELEEHLITCAKARGFKEGVKISTKPIYDHGSNYKLKGEFEFEFDVEFNILESKSEHFMCTIFDLKTNKWAEIIKDELPRINGYEGEFVNIINRDGNRTDVKYGYASFAIQDIRTLRDAFQYSNRNIASVNLDSGVTITMEQVEKIIKVYDEFNS